MFMKTLKCVLLMLVLTAFAAAERGFTAREANLYVAPDITSQKMADVERGRLLASVEAPDHPQGWAHVFPTLKDGKELSGWMLNKGIVWASTPNGDRILFGEAADSEAEASRSHGRKGADHDAMRLYYAVYDLFPQSPLAGESLYRAADIKWQLDKYDVFSRPSAQQMEAGLRGEIDQELMKQVMKRFPGTKWADMAAFHLIDNKVCGDWQGLPKCPEKETELYEKYADQHPQSPNAAEALYNAAWRQSALVQIYKSGNEAGKAAAAKQHATALAQRVVSAYPQSDWAARAQALIFKVDQGVATWGNVVE
jgi:hypothetical protein